MPFCYPAHLYCWLVLQSSDSSVFSLPMVYLHRVAAATPQSLGTWAIVGTVAPGILGLQDAEALSTQRAVEITAPGSLGAQGT